MDSIVQVTNTAVTWLPAKESITLDECILNEFDADQVNANSQQITMDIITPKSNQIRMSSKSPQTHKEENIRVSRSTRKLLNQQQYQLEQQSQKQQSEIMSQPAPPVEDAVLEAISSLENDVNNTFKNIEEKLLRTVKNINKDREQFQDQLQTIRNTHAELQKEKEDAQLETQDLMRQVQEKEAAIKKYQEEEQRALNERQAFQVFSLNIGGTHEMMTTSKVLCEGVANGSKLHKTFGPQGQDRLNKVGDKIFIDRDGKSFEHLINYLRNNGLIYPKFQSASEEKMFLAELQFWGINSSHLANLPVGHDMKKQYFQKSESPAAESIVSPESKMPPQQDTPFKEVPTFQPPYSPSSKQQIPIQLPAEPVQIKEPLKFKDRESSSDRYIKSSPIDVIKNQNNDAFSANQRQDIIQQPLTQFNSNSVEINQERSPPKLERSPPKLERSPARLERSPARIERSPARIERSPARLESSPPNQESNMNNQQPSTFGGIVWPSQINEVEQEQSKEIQWPSQIQESPTQERAFQTQQTANEQEILNNSRNDFDFVASQSTLNDKKEVNEVELNEYSNEFKDQFDSIFISEPENATPEAMIKWKELGPMNLKLIYKSGSHLPVDQSVKFQLSPFETGIIGQHTQPPSDSESQDPLTCTGLGRECDFGIYEGQYVDDEWNGFGRRIIASGDFYIGMWRDGMKNGLGRYVNTNSTQNKSGSGVSDNKMQPSNQQYTIVVEEGQWVDDEFQGQPQTISQSEYQNLLKTPLKLE